MPWKQTTTMNALSKVLIFKIAATVLVWCVPLLLLPQSVLQAIGFPIQQDMMFIRLLGWAYLALCVGYCFALKASLASKRLMGPIWVGIVSNGGASIYLCFYGLSGAWDNWAFAVQFIAWGSALATAIITVGLVAFGVKGKDPIVE